MPIQQMLLGTGAVATKTYVDDVFSTFLYKGNGTTTGDTQTINNGIDLAGEGGMVWTKSRDSGSYWHTIVDTVRGTNKTVYPNSNFQGETLTNVLNSFNNNGFTAAYNSSYSGVFTNKNNDNVASWTFRKSPAFTIKEYTGSGSTQSISHDLGSVPGMIIVKRTDYVAAWAVYHRQANGGVDPEDYTAELNTSGAFYNDTMWGDTKPTSTHFTVGDAKSETNASGGTYIAYIFAGGESTNALARSVDFDGTGDYLTWGATSDFAFGTGAYTVEFWVKPDTISGNKTFFNVASSGGFAVVISSSKVAINGYSVGDKVATSTGPVLGQWTHYALVREGTGSNQTKIYKNGVLEKTGTDSTDWTTTATTGLGANASNGNKAWDGEISNFRIVKGTAVYTSSFRLPTEPLTNITNTVLLCCNDAPTSATVTPGTITSVGTPITSLDSPFDDPAGFKFGESGSENVIKCGSYTTDSNEDATINLGWEPQWVLAKRIDSNSAADWMIVDSMRGFPNAQDVQDNSTGGTCKVLEANTSDAEANTSRIGITSTGFYADQFGSNREFIYMAIRRSDGYVGKPPELGTDVFAMDYGNGNSTIPVFDSGFPVDFALDKKTALTSNWEVASRLTPGKYSYTNLDSAEYTFAAFTFDSNAGWNSHNGYDSNWLSWMWKRHAGFDVCTWAGDGVTGRQIPHSMGVAPEMMWVKRRNANENWYVYHKGHNGGSGPEHWFTSINTNGVEQDHGPAWNDTVPTSTHFTLGADTAVNSGGTTRYMAMLFASTAVSKVGYYAGSNSSQTITTGFQPRFLLIKMIDDSGGDWVVFDTTRGWGSGNDNYILLNENSGQASYDFGAPTSNGFTLVGNATGINMSPYNFIYYAHA